MKLNKFQLLCLVVTFLSFWSCLSYAEIGGRTQTKRERSSQQFFGAETQTQGREIVSTPNPDEALHLEALNLLKLERTEEARQKFRELEGRTSNVELKAVASASIGDSYYYELDYPSAYESYKETMKKYPVSDQRDYLKDRLLELSSKFGYTTVQNPPKNISITSRLRQVSVDESAFYAVQVGSFSSMKNAQALVGKLDTLGYDAYLASDKSRGMSRVRVGHFSSKAEAARQEAKLKREGYPTKIVS